MTTDESIAIIGLGLIALIALGAVAFVLLGRR